jgi:ABC-type transport system involved in multi-copper enzyme maturation permease subunit
MSTLTTQAHPEADAGLRPVPWRRMAGVIWRQHRFALAGVVALLGVVAAGVWIAGTTMHQSYVNAIACGTSSSPACQEAVLAFFGSYGFLSNGIILQALPALIGAFIGAPLLAREMETGTFRYAWTQGFGRWRWALAKLVSLAVAVTVPAYLLSLVLSWYYQPYFAPANRGLGLTEYTPFFPGLFDLRGVAFAAWTLAAFAIGALAGMLIRRVVPAIAGTLAVYAGLAFAVGGVLREHYLTPLVTSSLSLPGSAWILGQWWTKGGATLSSSTMHNVINSAWEAVNPPPPGGGAAGGAGKDVDYLAVLRYLTRHGYTQWTRYQPASRFWPLQWVEGGWLLALSLLLITATVWLVRRRAA